MNILPGVNVSFSCQSKLLDCELNSRMKAFEETTNECFYSLYFDVDWKSNFEKKAVALELIKKKKLPLIFSNGKSLALDVWHDNLPELKASLIEMGFTDEIISEIKKLCEFFTPLMNEIFDNTEEFEIKKELDFIKLTELKNKSEVILKKLEELSVSEDLLFFAKSQLPILQAKLNQRENQARIWIEENSNNKITIDYKNDDPSKILNLTTLLDETLFIDSIALSIKDRCFQNIPYIMSLMNFGYDIRINKPVSHFILDKCLQLSTIDNTDCGRGILFVTSQHDDGFIYENGLMFLEALHKTRNEMHSMPDILYEDKIRIEKIFNEIFLSYGPLIKWDMERNCEIAAKEAFNILKDSALKFPLLIPTGNEAHSTLVSIQKNENDTVKLTVYNTGDGLKHHPCSEKDSRHRQTNLSYDNIPINVVTEEVLYQLFDAKNKKSIEVLYNCFHQIGKEGKIVPPSTSNLDYEMIQMYRSCSAQCQMAFLRHYIFSNIPGTVWHKLGLYKILKAKTLFHIASSRIMSVDRKIASYVQNKLVEFELEQNLIEMARDENGFKTKMEEIYSVLQNFGETEFIETIRTITPSTCHERFSLLRAVARHLSYKLKDYQEVYTLFKNDFELGNLINFILLLVKEKQDTEIHISRVLNRLKDVDYTQTAKALCRFLKGPLRYRTYLLNWIKQIAAEDSRFFIFLLKDRKTKQVLLQLLPREAFVELSRCYAELMNRKKTL